MINLTILELLELVFQHGTENLVATVIFKFNFFSKAFNEALQIKNQKNSKNKNCELFLKNINKLCLLLNAEVNQREELFRLKKSIFSAPSWYELNSLLNE